MKRFPTETSTNPRSLTEEEIEQVNGGSIQIRVTNVHNGIKDVHLANIPEKLGNVAVVVDSH